MTYPHAIVEEGAEIGENVTIEPFAVIKKNVKIGNNVTIKSHAYLDGHTTIGDGTTIYPGASIGLRTQAHKYSGETTYVQIGKNCEIREYVTINASFNEGSIVSVGDNCLIMAYCHIAHHCKVGNNVVMSNASMLAGHVTVGDYVVIGGMTPIHQHVRVGSHAMVGGFSRVTHDIPPYTIGAGYQYKLAGLNLVGLKRSGFTLDQRKALTQAFKLTFRSDLKLSAALERIESEVPGTDEIANWLEFMRTSKRGISTAAAEESPTVRT